MDTKETLSVLQKGSSQEYVTLQRIEKLQALFIVS